MGESIEEIERRIAADTHRLDALKHTPMTDEEFAAADKAIQDALRGSALVGDVLTEAYDRLWRTFSEVLTPLARQNKRLAAEARYWKQRAMDAQESPRV